MLTLWLATQAKSNILAQFPHTSEYMIARGFVIVVLVFSFPLIFFPLRVTLHNLLTSLFNLTLVDPRTVLVTNPHRLTLISLTPVLFIPCTTSRLSHCLIWTSSLLPHCLTHAPPHCLTQGNSQIRQQINSNFSLAVHWIPLDIASNLHVLVHHIE